MYTIYVKDICDVFLSVWINDEGITLEFTAIKLFCFFQFRRKTSNVKR